MNRTRFFSLLFSAVFFSLLLPLHAQGQTTACTDSTITTLERQYDIEAAFAEILDILASCEYTRVKDREIYTRGQRLQALSLYYRSIKYSEPLDVFKEAVAKLVEMDENYSPYDSDPPFFEIAIAEQKDIKDAADKTRQRRWTWIGIGTAGVISGMAALLINPSSEDPPEPLPGPPADPN